MSSQPRFIHLRTHTQYSLLEGAVPVKKLPGLCAAHDMPAVAMTDTNNMFAALEFSVTAAGEGVQPIIGCQVDVCFDPAAPGEAPKAPAAVVLLAQTEEGYEGLMRLNTCLYVDKNGALPQVTLEDLEANAAGVICLTGGAEGPVGKLLQNGQRDKAESLIRRLHSTYGDRLYIELQRHPGEGGQPQNPSV